MALSSALERVEGFEMGARPIYPYDAGVLAALLGIGIGSRVLEAGTGSGGMSFYLNSIGARVISYEREKKFFEKAKKNLVECTNVQLVQGDVLSTKEHGFDAIFLDLQNPAKAVARLKGKLKTNGSFGVYSPIMDDIAPVWRELEKIGTPRAVQLDLKEVIVKKYARIKGPLGYPGFFLWAKVGKR